MAGTEQVRVLLADDHPLFAQGVRQVIDSQPDLRCVGVATDGEATLDLVERLVPDIVLLDLRMPKRNGIEILRRAGTTRSRFIVLTTFNTADTAKLALDAGAAGFLTKDAMPTEVIAAIRAVSAGLTVRNATELGEAISQFTTAPGSEDPLTLLSDTERRILRLLAQGLSNREIAGLQFITEATVKTHVTAVLRKLGLQSRTQAVVFAFEHGLTRAAE